MAMSRVMISSTALDLPEHRKAVRDACLRLNFSPLMVEELGGSSDRSAAAASLRLVDEADIYIGIFGLRYGYVPQGSDISIVEMEYNRAVERAIPRLIFIMSDDHAVKRSDVDTNWAAAAKLKALKERLKTENIANFFESAEDLRALVINSLIRFREPDLTTFHYVGDIPAPPEPYIAHPYTLLQTHGLVGRQAELNVLTDWVAKPDSKIYRARILNVVAIGGMGKSALTWKWFNDVAPQEMRPLAGRLWWSFYESDATFENFVTRALAYVTRRPLEEVQQTPAHERETQLLAALDREPFLFVLDGLERILIAYARMDAVRPDDDDYDERTASFVANAYGPPASAAQSFTGEHRLRKTADPRAGSFLRKLANVRASRILVSTRLYPADLQTVTGEPLSSSAAIFLTGLSDDDALELWRSFRVTGAREPLLQMFYRHENNPLLIQVLASEVARYRRAPGDFERWREDHPDFDPFKLPLVQVRSHVLEFALRGLAEKTRRVLRTIAAFRMPARYDTLAALLIGEGKPCADEREFDGVLTELEDRGLVGWDKRANRYDLHPIVRAVVWNGLGDDDRRDVYTSLQAHFEAAPKLDEWEDVRTVEDLTPAIELYNTLVSLERYDDAYAVFYERLGDATLYRLAAVSLRAELLELFFPEGLAQTPRLSRLSHRAYVLGALAQSYHSVGQPGRALQLYRSELTIRQEENNQSEISVCLANLGEAQFSTGRLRDSEYSLVQALLIDRNRSDLVGEAAIAVSLGQTLSASGAVGTASRVLSRALQSFERTGDAQSVSVAMARLAWHSVLSGDHGDAQFRADVAWDAAHGSNFEPDFIRAARVQGWAALLLNNLSVAEERLHHALGRARASNIAEDEALSLAGLAELRRRQGDLRTARELLDDCLEVVERGPYPLWHAEALDVLVRIELDSGNQTAAAGAATLAYRVAWCDGPPYSYKRGLEAARKHLAALKATEPVMPPFDEAAFETIPEAELDPQEEFSIDAPDLYQDSFVALKHLVATVPTVGRRIWGPQHASRARLREIAGEELLSKNAFPENAGLLREVLDLRKIDRESPAFVSLLKNIAQGYSRRDRRAEAEYLLREAGLSSLEAIKNRPLEEIATFFKAASYEIFDVDGEEFHVRPIQPVDLASYGISLVRYFKSSPSLAEMQAFGNAAVKVSKSQKSYFHTAFIVCPNLESHLQLQAAVYQDEGLAIVPLTYSWIREASARGEQRQEMQSVLKAFVGRQDPFHYSNPVKVPGDFYGRATAAAQLTHDLDRGQSAGLFGMRKIGKTSLIQHTLRTRIGPTIYIDCQGTTSCRIILKRLPSLLRESLFKITSLPGEELPAFDAEEYGDAAELAEAVRNSLIGLYKIYADNAPNKAEVSLITVVLDEVDRLVSAAKSSEEHMADYEVLFGLLRNLGQDIEPILVCMVSGFSPEITHADTQLSLSSAGNPVFAFFKTHRLTPMSVPEISSMMNGIGSRVRLSFTDESCQRLHAWTGGHPFLARLTGSIIHTGASRFDLQRTNTDGGEVFVVHPAAVDAASQSLITDVEYRPLIKEILERYQDDVYRSIFLSLAGAGEEGRTRAELLESSSDSGAKTSMVKALDDLEFSHLVTSTGDRYRLFARLLAELIRRGYV